MYRPRVVLYGEPGMGQSYIEIFSNYTKRVFDWLLDLFDHKVVPKVPSDSDSSFKPSIFGGNSNTSSGSGPSLDLSNWGDSLIKTYNPGSDSSNVAWYRDLTTS